MRVDLMIKFILVAIAVFAISKILIETMPYWS